MCPLLQQLLRRTDSPGAVKARVLRCLSSWVLLDVPLNESEGLVHDCFSALPDPELFDTAVEAIVNAISQPDSQRCVGGGGPGVELRCVRCGKETDRALRKGRRVRGREGLIQGKLTARGRRAAFLGWLVLLWLQSWLEMSSCLG